MPWYQQFIRIVMWLFVGFSVAGVVVGGINDMATLITFKRAFVITALIFGGWLTIQISLYFRALPWMAKGEIVRIKKLNRAHHVMFVGVVLLVWLPLTVHPPERTSSVAAGSEPPLLSSVVSGNFDIPELPAAAVSQLPTSSQEVALLPKLNYDAFELLSAEMLVDMRRWVPFSDKDSEIRTSPVIVTKRFIGRKLQPIDEIRMYAATEGLAIDAECLSGQPFRIEFGCATGKPRVNLMKEYHVIVDISAIPVSSRFEVVTRMITWNGMKEEDPWHAFVGDAPIPGCGIQLVFPTNRPFKSRKFVTYPPNSDLEESAEGKYKQLERKQKDQLYWEPKPIEPGRTYEIQWTW